MTEARQAPRPSCLRPPLFVIGQGRGGHWVVQSQNDSCGGIFVDRKAALKFARAETGGRPQAVAMVSGILELDLSRRPDASFQRNLAIHPRRRREVA